MPILLKFVLIGDSNVGKTAVMRRLLGERFDPAFIMTTNGEARKRKTLLVDNQRVDLELWDAPGHERFRTDAALYIRDARAVLVFFDVTNEASFQNIDNWLKFIPQTDSPAQKPLTFIIGNKTDKEPRRVEPDEAQHVADKNNSPYYETSARVNDNEHFNRNPRNPGEPWYKKCVLL
ncbi:ras-related protein SEC4-like isoform X2 [Dendronephthya gigantea]|uniref:ras-related protein SEC4-like isoform X2 n=1 Tax=Dendronephthya gigantea TaxID=151771 RepID=UPI00106CE02C|nr:ras-related protein SEC4-like isoform X2 [Dendronephthya gigantea]